MNGKDREQAARLARERAEKVEAQYKRNAGQNFSTDEIRAALRDNEAGDAGLLIKAMKDKFCFDPVRQEFFRFEDCHWKRDIEEEFSRYAGRTLKNAYAQEAKRQFAIASDGQETEEAKKAAMRLYEACLRRLDRVNSLRGRENALKLARKGKTDIVIKGKEWNADPWKLQAGDKIIDLKTGEARQGTPKDYINRAAPTIWKGLSEPCVKWIMFLHEVFGNDKELIAYIQKVLGAALVGKPINHEFYVFYGEGRNGKGTMLETLIDVLGENLASPIKNTMLMEKRQNNGGADPELLDLQNMLIVWCSETEENKKLDTAFVKRFTGGDTLVARLNYSNNPVKWKPTHTLFLLTNHKPRIAEGDTAIWDRLRLIPFLMRFVDNPQAENERKKDPELKDKLIKEASGILAWLVEGCLKWQQEGMKPPEIVTDFSNEYKLDQSPVQQFIEDKCELGEQYRVQAKTLYDSFVEWFEENYGEKAKPPSLKSVSARVQKVPGIERRKDSRHTYFWGVDLK